MSRVAAQLVIEQCPDLRRNIEPRESEINVKGKGAMQTYWLTAVHTRVSTY